MRLWLDRFRFVYLFTYYYLTIRPSMNESRGYIRRMVSADINFYLSRVWSTDVGNRHKKYPWISVNIREYPSNIRRISATIYKKIFYQKKKTSIITTKLKIFSTTTIFSFCEMDIFERKKKYRNECHGRLFLNLAVRVIMIFFYYCYFSSKLYLKWPFQRNECDFYRRK